ncbi:biliverdin-producing heme oxygenase [Paraburkholderia bengalensis]|uniref:Biliverdin-producing heme oxygenase n=1 Tax=Paraburkholderia bengalensis TaxID=2747562 RepID=A0ABU8J345_9BURK
MSLQSSSAVPDSLDVLAALREATGSRHARVDASMPLSNDNPTLDDYRLHLQLIAAWLAPLERWLARFDDGPQRALPAIVRMPLIERDLAESSLPRADGSATEPPAEAGQFADDDPAWRWGVCYVIEGSQLGGTVLYRQLRETLAPHPLRYLSGDGVPPGPRWKHFIEALRAQVDTPRDIARACEGAKAAFDALLALLPARAAAECAPGVIS